MGCWFVLGYAGEQSPIRQRSSFSWNATDMMSIGTSTSCEESAYRALSRVISAKRERLALNSKSAACDMGPFRTS